MAARLDRAGAGEEQGLVKEYLDIHDARVIDGNYRSLSYDRRMALADQNVRMKFGRIPCLDWAWKRNRHSKGRSRAAMTQGCLEKMDAEFVRWILWKGRRRRAKKRCHRVGETYLGKGTVLKNQRELDRFYQFYQALSAPDGGAGEMGWGGPWLPFPGPARCRCASLLREGTPSVFAFGGMQVGPGGHTRPDAHVAC